MIIYLFLKTWIKPLKAWNNFCLEKNGWTKKIEILKYLYGSIQYVEDLPMVLEMIEVVRK